MRNLLCCVLTAVVALGFFEGVSSAAKSKSVVMSEQALLWKASKDFYRTGIELAHALLKREHERGFSSISERLRVRTNAGGLIRVSRAYLHFLKKLSPHTGAEQKLFDQLKVRIEKLHEAATQTQGDAVKGKISEEAKGAMQAAIKGAWVQSNSPNGSLSKKAKEALLDVILGVGTGVELLSYYRLRQLAAGYKKEPNAKTKGALRSLAFATLNDVRLFVKFKKMYPKAGFGLFLYHGQLTFRCIKHLLNSKKKKAGKKHLKLYVKRLKQLESSLKKSNPSFEKLWQNAGDE